MKSVSEVLCRQPGHWVGDGFPVRSLFSYHSQGGAVSPFLLLDHAGPARFEPAAEPRGVDQHPHKGFDVVTLVLQGELEHRDSAGNRGAIGPGDVQWMTSGRGVVHEEKHSERFTREGGTLEMAQLWVNLPARHKGEAPRYQTLAAAEIPAVELDGGGRARVVAGTLDGATGPAATWTRLGVWELRLPAGAAARLPAGDGEAALVPVLAGRLAAAAGGDRAGEAEVEAGADETLLFTRSGEGIELTAREAAVALVLTGEPIDEPIAGHGPFVMNIEEEIRQAVEDYRQGRMGRLPYRNTHRPAAG